MQGKEGPVVVIATGTAASALDEGTIAYSREIPVAAAFNAEHDGEKLTFEIKNDQVVDKQTGSVWNALGHAVEGDLEGARLEQIDLGVHFSFAWLAFDPQAAIYGQ